MANLNDNAEKLLFEMVAIEQAFDIPEEGKDWDQDMKDAREEKISIMQHAQLKVLKKHFERWIQIIKLEQRRDKVKQKFLEKDTL